MRPPDYPTPPTVTTVTPRLCCCQPDPYPQCSLICHQFPHMTFFITPPFYRSHPTLSCNDWTTTSSLILRTAPTPNHFI
eukprot:670953-Hanusia_phi.AAC.1